MRLFYAIDLPKELKKQLSPTVASLRNLGRHIRTVGEYNLHLTMLFLGEQPEESVQSLCDIARAAVAPARPCKLEISGTGFFPGVSFLTLKGELETLAMISTILKDQCADYLDEPDNKPFKPHITLARHKIRISRNEKNEISVMMEPFRGRSFTANELLLYASELTPTGAVYNIIETFPFGG